MANNVNIAKRKGQGIPVFCTFRDAIKTGALMTYGPDFVEL